MMLLFISLYYFKYVFPEGGAIGKVIVSKTVRDCHLGSMNVFSKLWKKIPKSLINKL